jgi:hypothetical protein
MVYIDITKLAYEKITDVYYKVVYLGLDCIVNIETGYINGTKLCLSCKNTSKTIDNYINHYRYKLLISYYMSNISDHAEELFVKVKDSIKEIRGTYVHPILFLDLAIWISPRAYINASKIISTTLLHENENKEVLTRIENGIVESINRETNSEIAIEKIAIQNEKLYAKVSKSSKDTEENMMKIKNSLKRVETIIQENHSRKKPSFSFLQWFENTFLFCKKD